MRSKRRPSPLRRRPRGMGRASCYVGGTAAANPRRRLCGTAVESAHGARASGLSGLPPSARLVDGWHPDANDMIEPMGDPEPAGGRAFRRAGDAAGLELKGRLLQRAYRLERDWVDLL